MGRACLALGVAPVLAAGIIRRTRAAHERPRYPVVRHGLNVLACGARMAQDEVVTDSQLAVGLVGHSGAGKTEVAARLAERLSAVVVSFGEEVRLRVAAAGGDPYNRLELMAAGQELVERDVQSFCAAVLAQQSETADVPLIVEGIRHDIVRETLTNLLVPRRLVLVHLKTPESVRVQRLRERGAGDAEVDALQWDPTEVEVDQVLLGHADFIVDGHQPLDDVVDEILAFVGAVPSILHAPPPPFESPDTKSSEVSALDEEQQVELVNEISTEFRVWLPSELPSALGVDERALAKALQDGTLLRLRHGGGDLIPGFQFQGAYIRSDIGNAVKILRSRLTDWEIAAWLVSNNGWLDNQRPVDVGEDELDVAVEAELRDAGL